MKRKEFILSGLLALSFAPEALARDRSEKLAAFRRKYPNLPVLSQYLEKMCLASGGLMDNKRVSSFWIGATPLTWAAWEEYCSVSGVMTPKPPVWGPTTPVVNLSAVACETFCGWLTRESGLVFRLPTIFEFEYAARDGGKNQRLPWGDDDDDTGNLYWVSPSGTRKGAGPVDRVGNNFRNTLGLSDIVGNVSQWCSGNFPGESYYLKGGSWAGSGTQSFDCDNAETQSSTHYDSTFGFRLCSPEPVTPLPVVPPLLPAPLAKPRLAPLVSPEGSPAKETLYSSAFALVIGISKYQNLADSSYCPTAARDAAAVVALLSESFGFLPENTIVLTDEQATKVNIEAALTALANNSAMKDTDCCFIFFGGQAHTVQKYVNTGSPKEPFLTQSNEAFLAPFDAVPSETDSDLKTYIPMDNLWGYTDKIISQHNFLLLDMFANGVFSHVEKFRLPEPKSQIDVSNAKLLADNKEHRASQAIVSGKRGEGHLIIPGMDNGVLTTNFLEILRDTAKRKTILTASDLGIELKRKVRDQVLDTTVGRFLPSVVFDSHNTTGEFLFISQERAVVSPPRPAPPKPVEELPSLPIKGSFAELRIRTTPSDATVRVNGVSISGGVYRINLAKEKSKTFPVSVRMAGYEEKLFTVKLSAGKSLSFLVTLVKKSTILPLSTKSPSLVKPENPQIGDCWINPIDRTELVWIPSGTFLMGSDYGRAPFEKLQIPAHPVTVPGFWMAKHPITVAQYRRFRDSDKSKGEGMLSTLVPWGWQDDHPMVRLSWYEAKAYAAWAGLALPTEAQWEYAARGPENRRYPWGNRWDRLKCASSVDSDDILNMPRNIMTSTKPVGSYPLGVSPFGCFDMVGNVWEWCEDPLIPYPGGKPLSGILKNLGREYRICRGGCFASTKIYELRAMFRGSLDADNFHQNTNGARLVSV